MGVYIKCMEMPTNNDTSPTAVWVYPNGHTIVFKDNGKMKQYTEAVFVPPHGRLIEEAAAIETTWMILRGFGYLKGENPQLEQTVRKVFATVPAIEVE